jgi:hypothetical protein
MRRGRRLGECCRRQLAAFELSRRKDFAIGRTTLAETL